MQVEDVWVTGIPKLMTESAFRLVDVNQDGVLDVLFGFATGEWEIFTWIKKFVISDYLQVKGWER